MPRRVRVREPDDEQSGSAGPARGQWAAKWKTFAVSQLPAAAPRAVRVQLRVDVERALARYHPEDDEAEIRDLVASIVEETTARLAAKLTEDLHDVCRKAFIALAPAYLRIALAKFDRHHVAAMLKRPSFSSAGLTARLQRRLSRHLKGDENTAEVQRLVDVWVARRLDEQPPMPEGVSGRVAGAAGAVVAAAGIAYQHPTVKAAARQGLAKARQLAQQSLVETQRLIQQWRNPPPPEGPKLS